MEQETQSSEILDLCIAFCLLNSGTKLGAYEITGAIGAGGMGEVYRARDTKLGRDVALKVLPEAFAQDAERMARFRREAQVLASLNHPNIAAIYGFEDSGAVHALVMELVEGPTLAERISGAWHSAATAGLKAVRKNKSDAASGLTPASLKTAASGAERTDAIALDEALPMAKQIAEALEYAHERGIVHRDLKPANIKLASNDAVKVLDFGLAKALEGDASAVDISTSPTISRMATQAGIILGTAAYMSPEQAKGKAVDRRTDIWAFGCVLYEMLTGKQAFGGETVTDTLAAVIKSEPDWTLLPASTPQAVGNLLQRCLKKDARQRLQSIGDARIALEEMLSGAAQLESSRHDSIAGRINPPLQSRRRVLPWAIVAALAIVLAVFMVTDLTRKPAEQNAYVAQIPAPKEAQFVLSGPSGGPPVISPDGREIAFVAAGSTDEQSRLWVEPLDSDAAQPLAGTEGAYSSPFWSPDSHSIGYFAGGMMNRVDASGGPSVSIAAAPSGRGAAWRKDGTILYAPSELGGLYRVSASGGTPHQVTSVSVAAGGLGDRWPQFLPDGRHFLFYSQHATQGSGTYAGSLAGGKPTLLLHGSSNAVYAPPGYLLFVRQGTLMAQRFDTRSLRLVGEAEPVATGVVIVAGANVSNVSVSQTGVLTCVQGGTAGGLRQLLWYDRNGKQIGQVGAPGRYYTVNISPSGKQLALTEVGTGQLTTNVWIYDLARGTNTRLTFSSVDIEPAWSPDGKMIAFASVRGQNFVHLYEKTSDGSGNVKTLLADDASEFWPVWTPDGRYLLFTRHEHGMQGNSAIWALPLSGEGKPFAVLQNSQFDFHDPAVSPNGKWLAYVSSQSGQLEVYVSPFLHGEGLWEVSTGGGSQPQWRQDGKELFYMSPDHKMMAAEISEQGSAIVIGKAMPLFTVDLARGPGGQQYAVGPRGQKFLAITGVSHSRPSVTLVVNWPSLLKKQ